MRYPGLKIFKSNYSIKKLYGESAPGQKSFVGDRAPKHIKQLEGGREASSEGK